MSINPTQIKQRLAQELDPTRAVGDMQRLNLLRDALTVIEQQEKVSENADRTIIEVWKVAGIICLPSQTPRFIGEKLSQLQQQIEELKKQRDELGVMALNADTKVQQLQQRIEQQEQQISRKPWMVKVIGDDNDERLWVVKASTELDAMQIAFALDGGWNLENRDAIEMEQLVRAYCSAEMVNRIETKDVR